MENIFFLIFTFSIVHVKCSNLPISDYQLSQLATEVCTVLFPEEISENAVEKVLSNRSLCEETFKSTPPEPPEELAEGLPPVQLLCRMPYFVVVQLQPSESHQLVVAVPDPDYFGDDLDVLYAVVPPNGDLITHIDIYDSNHTLWSTTLDTSGRPGSWSKADYIGEMVVSDKEYDYGMKLLNFSFGGKDLIHSAAAEIEWDDKDASTQCFEIYNSCTNYFEVQKEQTKQITPQNGSSATFSDLILDGRCSLSVTGIRGKFSMKYHTPQCINETYCLPGIPEIISTTTTPSVDGSWQVRVEWREPKIQPAEYNVTVSNITTNEVVAFNTVPGVLQSAIVPGIDGYAGEELRLGVTAINNVARTSNSAIAVLQVETPEEHPPLWLQGGTAGVWAVVVVAGGAVVAVAGWVRRAIRNKVKMDWEDGISDMLKPYEPDVVIVPDKWEIPADKVLLHDVIGEGAFGVVRRGTLFPGNKDVAVKMLKAFPSREEVRSFRAEMELMKSVGGHPHVVGLAGCCSGQQPMIVAEYCSRGDLLNYLRSAWDFMMAKRNAKYYNNNEAKKDDTVINKMYDVQKDFDTELTVVDLLSYCRQIAMGMEFLASNRVVHRDLAARNVLVANDRTLKIADFGLSRDVYQENQYKQKGCAMLPIKWMALESLTDNIYTTQSDVWSFGVVMWEVMTVGGAPYPGVAATRLPAALRAGLRLPRPHNASNDLYDLMQSCWRTRPRERPTFTSLHKALDTLLNKACADDYLALEPTTCDILPPPVPKSYMSLLPKSLRYWTKKCHIYERPLKAPQSNHYTTAPDSLIRIHNIV